MTDTVTLDDFEMRMCGYVGKARFQNAEQHHRNHGLGPSCTVRTPERDIIGAQCEFAASLLVNRFWRPHVGVIDQPDVGGCVEVRSTTLPHGRLIVKPGDGDYPFVLIERQNNRFRFLGWMPSREAKDHYPLISCHGDPAHFVDQDGLGDLASLRALLAREDMP